MSKLEDFIRNNKTAFDGHEPSPALWSRIQKGLEAKVEVKKKDVKIVSFGWKRWAVAAAVVIMAAMSTVLFMQKNKSSQKLVASVEKDSNWGNDSQNIVLNNIAADTQTLTDPDTRDLKQRKPKVEIPINPQVSESEEMYHYARLIEIKQQQIAFLKTSSPELYEKFSSDLQGLNDSYIELKQKLDAGFNSEKLLEAMIRNLKLQTELLNKQLKISKRLKNKFLKNETVNSI